MHGRCLILYVMGECLCIYEGIFLGYDDDKQSLR